MRTIRSLFALVILLAPFCATKAQILSPILYGSAPSAGSKTWTYHNEALNESCASAVTTTCVITISTTAGHIYVVTSITGGNETLSSVTGDGTFIHCAGTNGCHTTGGNGTMDASYILSATGGATSLTCHISAVDSGFYACRAYDFSVSSGTVTFDTSNINNSVAACATCAGVALTLAGTNDMILQGIVMANNATAITAPYTSGVDVTDGVGTASAINTASGASPNWTQNTSGTAQEFAIALQLN